MKKTVFRIFAILFLTPLFSEAQIGGLLNKAKDKAENKVEQKTEQKVDQKTSGSSSSSSSGTSTSGSTSGNTNSGTTPAAAYRPFVKNFPEREMTETHKQHIGEILFYSPATLQQTEEFPSHGKAFRPSESKKDFKYREPLYCCFYMENCLGNIPTYKESDTTKARTANAFENYQIKIMVDGKPLEKAYAIDRIEGSDHPNVFSIHLTELRTDKIDGLDPLVEPTNEWNEILNNLSEGTHKIRMELWGDGQLGYMTYKPVCSGEFSILKSQGDKFGTSLEESKKYELAKSIKDFNDGKIKDNGITSDTHKNNTGKIVFSKTHLGEDGAENTAAIQGNFTGADLIYAKCFMKESFWNIPLFDKVTPYTYDTVNVTRTPIRNIAPSFTVVYLIDGKEAKDIPEIKSSPYNRYNEPDHSISSLKQTTVDNENELNKKRTTFELYIRTSKAELNQNIGGNDWSIIANALTPGEHTIQVIVWAGDPSKACSREPVCTGEFKYTKVQGLTVSVGKDWNVVAEKAGMSNPSLEGQMKALLLKDENIKSVSHLVITSSEWTINRNDLTGIIISRAISAWCITKNSDGYYQTSYCTFKEDYNGSGYTSLYGGAEGGYVLQYIDGATLK